MLFLYLCKENARKEIHGGGGLKYILKLPFEFFFLTNFPNIK